MGDYNLNYLNTQAKQSLDTILTLYNLEVVNKTTPSCSKSLIDYFITDLNLTKLKIKVSSFTAPIITDHLATFLISELKLVVETVPIKRTICDESNYAEKEFESGIVAHRLWPGSRSRSKTAQDMSGLSGFPARLSGLDVFFWKNRSNLALKTAHFEARF